MTFQIQFQSTPPKNQDAIALFIYDGNTLSEGAKKINKAENDKIRKILAQNTQFTGKSGDILLLNGISDTYGKICLIGLGKENEQTLPDLETLAGTLWQNIKKIDMATLCVDVTALKIKKKPETSQIAAHFALGLKLAAYHFNKYKKKKEDDEKKTEIKTISIILDQSKEAASLFDTYSAVAEGVHLARDLVNEPPNTLYPESYVARIKDELKPLGIEIDILDEKKMARLGFDALLAVGQGSIRESQTVIMRWNGDKKSKNLPIALVGKGVTFDTGGISLKPGAEMDLMKMDMGGSATVVGTMKALAGRKAKINAIGIVGLVENMPSDRAYRPGDIIGSYAGKTIEVLNTDAEGRLVLADILSYVQDKYKPEVIIDLATLTGAIMVALGFEYCGAFANDDKLWSQIENASKNTGEKFWRMPLDKAYKKEMESEVADLRNLGSLGRYGGACSAAGFLEHFIKDGIKWAHIDIAGTAWWKTDKPTTPKGGTGFGVRALDDLIKNHYEK